MLFQKELDEVVDRFGFTVSKECVAIRWAEVIQCVDNPELEVADFARANFLWVRKFIRRMHEYLAYVDSDQRYSQ